MSNRTKCSIVAVLALGSGAAAQNSLFIAHDTSLPIKEFTKAGAYVTDWGESMNVNATGPAIGDGYIYTTNPNATSTIYRFDSGDNFINSYAFVGGGDPGGNGLPGWVEDAAYAGAGNLWIGGYNGEVSLIDPTGAIISQFYTGTTYTGVAFDGKTLYTTHGFYGGTSSIEMWDTSGNHLGSIAAAGPTENGGIGWDSDDNTLWVGYLDATVRHFDMAGNLLGSFSTGFPNAIDGLEVGTFVPAPGAGAILGLAGLVAGRRRRV